MRTTLLVLTLAACLAAPALAASSGATLRYVVGAAAPGVNGGLVCSTAALPLVVGGACDVPAAASVSVAVVDDALGPVGFNWWGRDAAGGDCGAAGREAGPATLALGPSCVRLMLWPATGATTGLVHVS